MSWLLRLEHKPKIYSNAFRIRIFLFRSFSFRIDTINTLIRSRCSLENHTRFHRKIYTRFRTEKVHKPYPLGRHIPIWLFHLPPPPPPPPPPLGRRIPIWFFPPPPPPPGVLSKILFSASFICLVRSPQLGTLLKDHYDEQQTLWIIRFTTFFQFYFWNCDAIVKIRT